MLIAFIAICTASAIAQVNVRGYVKKDGAYVQPHVRSNPDGNPYNNYSYTGNYNPYTGKTATGNEQTYLDRNQNTNSNSGYPSYYNPAPSPPPIR